MKRSRKPQCKITERLGRRISDRRHALKKSQEGIAEEAGMNVGYLGELEIGLRFPSTRMIIAIADTLGVDLAYFFVRDEDADSYIVKWQDAVLPTPKIYAPLIRRRPLLKAERRS